MDKNDCITISAERKRGQHLGAEEGCAIEQLKKLGCSNRAVALSACLGNPHFSAGWWSRFVRISGHWMPALVVPS